MRGQFDIERIETLYQRLKSCERMLKQKEDLRLLFDRQVIFFDILNTLHKKNVGLAQRQTVAGEIYEYLNLHFSQNITLEDLSKRFGYSKDHIILLIYIYYLKNFLSINDIQNLLKPVSDNYFQKQEGITMSSIYEDLFQLEKEYGIKIRESVAEVYEIADNAYSDKDDYLKTLQEKAVGLDIKFIPKFVPDDVLNGIILESDVIVLPYREISQSGVLLLALYFERPIICSGLPSFKETLEGYNSHLFFEKDSPKDLARVIAGMVSEPNLDATDVQSLKKKYSWENIAQMVGDYVQ